LTAPFTMKSAADLLKTLMDGWEAALFHAERTGYWLDVTACDHVVEAYGAEIAKALQSGQLSGDGAEALRRWTALTASEAEYRMTMMAEARKTAPVVNPSCWWVLSSTLTQPRAK
jgi:hypothetical protein